MFWRVLNEWGVMPQRYYFWATCLSGGLLYCLVFIFAQDFVPWINMRCTVSLHYCFFYCRVD